MYSFGIPSYIIQIGHLLMGGFFMYIGYYKKITKPIAAVILMLGALAVSYHSHLLYLSKGKEMLHDIKLNR